MAFVLLSITVPFTHMQAWMHQKGREKKSDNIVSIAALPDFALAWNSKFLEVESITLAEDLLMVHLWEALSVRQMSLQMIRAVMTCFFALGECFGNFSDLWENLYDNVSISRQ